MRWFVIVLVLLCGSSMGRAGADALLPTGIKAVWDFERAARQTTATRERVCLNGLWRWQPGDKTVDVRPAGDWGYTKVPGPWPGSRGDYMWVDSQRSFRAPAWKSADLSKVVVGWYQREFTIPPGWAGRRIAVSMEYLYSVAAVYVDGVKCGEAYFPGGEVEITRACGGAGKHVLLVRVAAVPLGEETTYFAENGAGTSSKSTVQLRGLCGDTYLIASPAGARLTDAKIETSVQKWELAVSAAMTNLDPQAKYRLHARVLDDGKTVHEMVGDTFRQADLKDGRFVFRGGWKPGKLWDLTTPANQYQLQLSLVDEQSSTLDELPAIRFGFREFWIDGRDFRLNGSRIHCFAVPLDSAQISAASASYSGARETFRRLKTFGVNLVYTHNYGCIPGQNLSFAEILCAADDAGVLVSFSMPHVNAYDWKKSDEQAASAYARHAAYYVQAAQNHPAVVMYAMNHNLCGYADEHNPDHMDGMRDKSGTIRQPDDRNAKLALRAQAIVSRLDSTRVIYHHGGANLGQTYTVNIYLNHVPSQERCDWFGHWATEGIKPLLLAEYGTPSDIDWTTYRGYFRGERSWGNGAVTYEACFPEWGAQYRGGKAYDITEKEKQELRWEAKAWQRGQPWHRWDYPYGFPTYKLDIPNILDVMAMYITDDWRAYRSWGVSAFNSWELERMWVLRPGFAPERKTFDVDWDQLQRPGYSPDFLDRQHEQFEYAYEASDWVPTVAAQAVIRNSQPLLAYLGGGADHFTVKDHNFHAGQRIDKQIIAINESREPVTLECDWALHLPRPIEGHTRLTIETGEQKRVPIQCQLPADLAPGTYQLTLKATPVDGEPQDDTFAITVLAPTPSVETGEKVALFDPPGQTAQLLRRLGVTFQQVRADADLAGVDTLILGKAALTTRGAAPDVSRVRDGLKVIVFEQTAEVLEKRLGFHVEEYGLRQVFKRLPDHPALAGLASEHLANWRGQATIIPPRLSYQFDPNRTPTIRWCGLSVSRPWRCGNDGNVASVLIEKPGRGDFLPILDGGFSLQYAPLMEYHEGRGMILFCQMDVTGRTDVAGKEDVDPAGDLLVRNILQYVERFKAAPSRRAFYVGEPAGQAYLQKSGIAPLEYDAGRLIEKDVLVIGPGSGAALKANRQAVADFLKAGGHAVALGVDESDVSSLPFKITMGKREYITTTFEPPAMASPLRGVGPADLDNRDPRVIPLIDWGATVLGKGVLGVSDPDGVVLCQLVPWQFDYENHYNLKRTYRRASFAVVRILANAGVAAPTPILTRFSTPVLADQGESRWLDGLYVDQPEEWDDPYRFFCW